MYGAVEQERTWSTILSQSKRRHYFLSAIGLVAVAAACLLTLVSRNTDRPVELLEGRHTNALTNLYKKDVERGEAIISKMENKVSSPLWEALVHDHHMRKVLAAALGAQKSVAGAGGGGLGALFGGGSAALPSNPSKAVVRHSAQRMAKAHATHMRAQGSDEVASSSADADQHNEERHHEQLNEAPRFVYNVFAPGVLSGKPEPPARKPAPVKTQAKTPAKHVVKSKHQKNNLGKALVDGFKKATGFDDNYEQSHSKVAELERKVQALTKKAAASPSASKQVRTN
jgi:hypothetical protein